jgi:phage-related protein
MTAPMTGDPAFRGAGVLEVVDDYDSDTYRAVYTVRFAGVVYVLDAFQKKARRGVATPQPNIERIKRRLQTARDHYESKYGKREAS